MSDTLREVLEFYADPQNWRSPSEGFALQYDPEPSPISHDGGARAQEVLRRLGWVAPAPSGFRVEPYVAE